ncbi:glucosaminidase domain-containing protein [Psychrosphaera haliotis]|uniref:glucosaminidase domain-containing protein n=1 Tax=Psychrosphaera haliotis TaxID=555083 RepID=UPI00236FE9AB|nr:glucosaminidase domain-containing protein [Psychrosphaera haliotis]
MQNQSVSSKATSALAIIIVLLFGAYPFVSKQTTTFDQEVMTEEEQTVTYANEFLPNFAEYNDVKEKKRAFFSYLQPLVEQVNSEVEQQRDFISNLTAIPTAKNEKQRFNKILKRYSLKNDVPFEELKTKVLRRADTLPVALVLMQAANESAWGTSRFALEANNLFGQWCFKKGCGVVPTGRPAGETYEVRMFHHPIASIRSYFNNLNTGHAYVMLRDVREELRAEQEELDPQVLATGLLKYSIRREAYVEEIQTMIRVNNKYID